ncbi:hypothetical protein D3C76_845610 [compost metagenome]
MLKQEAIAASKCVLVDALICYVHGAPAHAGRLDAELDVSTDGGLYPGRRDNHTFDRGRVVDVDLLRHHHRVQVVDLFGVPGVILPWVVTPMEGEHLDLAAMPALGEWVAHAVWC